MSDSIQEFQAARSDNLWTRWQEQFGLLNCPIIAIALAAGSFVLLERSGLAFGPMVIDRLLAAKLTFLSLTLAAGFVQYSYLYQIRSAEGERVRAGDSPYWLKQAREELVDLERSGRSDAGAEKWKADRKSWLEQQIRRCLAEMRAFNVPHFRMALSMLFGLGLSLWASIISDVVWLLAQPSDIPELRRLSAATTVSSIVLFTAMFIRYLLILRRELINFFDY